MGRTRMLRIVSLLMAALAVSGTTVDPGEGPKEVKEWFHQLSHAKQKLTELHLYFHNFVTGDKPTAVSVSKPKTTISSRTGFGAMDMVDARITAAPQTSSKVIGYVQGLYGGSSLEEVAMMMIVNLVFTDGIYNGSTLAVMGYNPPLHRYREVVVVGGTGVFRLARGVVTLKTYLYNETGGYTTDEVYVAALHY